jgi:hypothetical protein
MNPLRTSRSTGRVLGSVSLGGAGQEAPQSSNGPIGFYPAITHFTDAITALPREFRRHTSLLKEVDAKAWGPEERLQAVLDQVSALPNPKKALRVNHGNEGQTNNTSRNTDHNTSAENSALDHACQTSAHAEATANLQRRELFQKLKYALLETIGTMDEKNHVLGEATITVNRQVAKLNAVLPHVENEISEDARWGNLNHWAYSADKTPAAKAGTTANERSRREINHAPAAVVHDTDIASRSELRREAVQARRQRHQAVDSDFDDSRTSKRPNGTSKAKRPIDAVPEASVGLGISANTASTKRRKVEKPNPAAIAMERTLSGAMSNTARGTSREPSAPEVVKKRRAPPTSNNGTRKRQVMIQH